MRELPPKVRELPPRIPERVDPPCARRGHSAAVVFASSITGAGAQGRWPVPWRNMPWNEVAVQVLHFLLLLVGVLVALEHMRQWAYEAYRWWLGEPAEGSTESAAEPTIQILHPDRMYWTTRGGRIHLTLATAHRCATVSPRQFSADKSARRAASGECGVMIHQLQARPLDPSSRPGAGDTEPPRDDSGLRFTLQPEDNIVPAPPVRDDPPEEEPEPSLDSEIDESWPGSSSSGGQEH